MKHFPEELEPFRLKNFMGDPGALGTYRIPFRNEVGYLHTIISWHAEWDHVSVSLPHRTPTWEEMYYIKSLFFLPDEAVVQYHPRASEYVNVHPYCLHLWRPQLLTLPEPPSYLVI